MAIGISHLFSQMSGSVAGVTYFWNRYASICMRSRVSPVDPNTPAQQTVRTRMSAAVAAWQALSESDRLSWTVYAAGTPWQNSLGQDTRLTGMNMYLAVRLAVLRINPTANMALLDLAYCTPGMFILPDFGFSACSGGGTGFNLDLVNPHPTDNMRVGVHISTAQNTSVNFWKGPYDTAAYQSTASIAPSFGTQIAYKGMTAGKRYFLRLRAWNNSAKTLISNPLLLQSDAAVCAP